MTDLGGGRYEVRDTTYDDPVDLPRLEGAMRVSSIVCYLIAFVTGGDAHRYVGLRLAVYITMDEAVPAA